MLYNLRKSEPIELGDVVQVLKRGRLFLARVEKAGKRKFKITTVNGYKKPIHIYRSNIKALYFGSLKSDLR